MNADQVSTRRTDTTSDISTDDLAALRNAMERARRDAQMVQDVSAFTDAHVLALDIAGFGLLRVRLTTEQVLGRTDSHSEYRPDVDLSPFGAQRMGISRRHVLLKRVDNAVYLIDLGSRNGTMINNQRLEANITYMLHSSDEIVLGTLRLRVSFARV